MNDQRDVEERGRRFAGHDTREQLLAELPVKERRLELASVSSAVLEGGERPPVLLLHGPGEFAALWARVIPDLTGTHRVVAPDLPGHGATGLPDGPLDHDRVLTWLGELIERTCASPPALVGHLLGGAIAARYACERPDQLSRLVLRQLRPELESAVAQVRAAFVRLHCPSDRTHAGPLPGAVLRRFRRVARPDGRAL